MEDRSGGKPDLVIIGSGLAGTAAACFASMRGLKIAQVSSTAGESGFSGGLLDLLAVYPPGNRKLWDNPWEGVAALIEGSPQHPYAGLGIETIREAMREFLAFMGSIGLEYLGLPDRNVTLVTAAGTLKTTYRTPRSMWKGTAALERRGPTLLVDFEGMKDFSARLIAETLRSVWPALRACRVPFPLGFPGVDLQNLLLAEAVESQGIPEKLAEAIRPHLSDAQYVGMPAVLGIRAVDRVIAELEDRLNVGIFEIPTLPPSVPALRFREAVEEALMKGGARIFHGCCAGAPSIDGDRCVGITIGGETWRETLDAEGFILAGGRFLGGGLAAERDGIRETVFGLYTEQPRHRSLWHRDRFLDPQGHPINEAGLVVDDRFRPVGKDGRCACRNLFAAGSTLARQDWTRTKSGAGLAISTAYGAVEAFLRGRSR